MLHDKTIHNASQHKDLIITLLTNIVITFNCTYKRIQNYHVRTLLSRL